MRKRERDRTFVRKRDYKWEREATSYETRDERYEIREREREREIQKIKSDGEENIGRKW